MAGRRKLIVVSNRGPVLFARDAAGERVARRGGGGLVTALRSLVEHHDVTWIASAMSEEDRSVAAEADGEAIEETARDGAAYRLRLVAHDPAAYDWYYNVSRTRCCGSSSTTCGVSRARPTSTTASTTPGTRATWP